jgi:hypothetical protein
MDLVGQRFGRWKVVALHPQRRGYQTCWLCRCDCGTERVVLGFVLRQGESTSCGCARHEKLLKRLTTHGLSKSRPYSCWENMMQRCFNLDNPSYPYYGGREPPEIPITVVEYYRDFSNWYADIGYQLHDKHLSQDRIDNNRGYEPGNCQAATAAEQVVNRRSPKRKMRRA